MIDRIAAVSPRRLARITGAFSLLVVLTAIFSQVFVSGTLIVPDNAATTAANILSHKSLFELAFTVYLVEMASNVVITGLFYELFRPVNRTVSLLAAFLGLTFCIVKTFSRLFFIAPLFLLGAEQYLTVFNRDQLQALALLFLKVNDQGAGMAMAFFAFYYLLIGYLILKSTFLPRILGVLTALSGLCWLTYLSPTLGFRIVLYIGPFVFLVALAMIVWFLVFGVDEQRWKQQAGAVATAAAA